MTNGRTVCFHCGLGRSRHIPSSLFPDVRLCPDYSGNSYEPQWVGEEHQAAREEDD